MYWWLSDNSRFAAAQNKSDFSINKYISATRAKLKYTCKNPGLFPDSWAFCLAEGTRARPPHDLLAAKFLGSSLVGGRRGE